MPFLPHLIVIVPTPPRPPTPTPTCTPGAFLFLHLGSVPPLSAPPPPSPDDVLPACYFWSDSSTLMPSARGCLPSALGASGCTTCRSAAAASADVLSSRRQGEGPGPRRYGHTRVTALSLALALSLRPATAAGVRSLPGRLALVAGLRSVAAVQTARGVQRAAAWDRSQVCGWSSLKPRASVSQSVGSSLQLIRIRRPSRTSRAPGSVTSNPPGRAGGVRRRRPQARQHGAIDSRRLLDGDGARTGTGRGGRGRRCCCYVIRTLSVSPPRSERAGHSALGWLGCAACLPARPPARPSPQTDRWQAGARPVPWRTRRPPRLA